MGKDSLHFPESQLSSVKMGIMSLAHKNEAVEDVKNIAIIG